MSSTSINNVPVSVVGNEKTSAFADKLNRPLDEIVKESKKQYRQDKTTKKNNQRPAKKQPQQKGTQKQHRPSNLPSLKPDQVRVTIKNDYASSSRSRDGPSPRIMRRMEDVSYSSRPSRIDYGRPVSSTRYIPPPSRQPRIRKP